MTRTSNSLLVWLMTKKMKLISPVMSEDLLSKSEKFTAFDSVE